VTTVEAPLRPSTAILVACAAVFVVSQWIPFGNLVLYPLTLFTTWIHEMGHGLAAILVGGHFESLEIFASGGGLAHSSGYGRGIPDGLVAAGGLLMPPIVGSLVLAFVHGPRRARGVLAGLAIALVLSLAIWVRSVTGVISMSLVAAALGYVAWRGSYRVIVAQVLGVLLAVDTLTRMVSYVFQDGVVLEGKRYKSDIANVAEGFGGHYVVWGLLVTALALAMLGLAIWWAWRPRRASRLQRT